MTNRTGRLAALTAAIALIVFASASLAQPKRYNPDHVSAARAAAIRECSIRANRFPETTYANTEFEIYRSCMREHGQPE